MSTAVQFIKRPFQWFLKTRRRNKVFILLAIVVLFFVLLGQIQRANAKPHYIFAKVARGNITELVSETGNIGSSSTTGIYSPTNGTVEEIYVANNDPVTPGQNLFKVKSSATEQEKAQALSSYLTAKTTLDTANSNLYTLQSVMFSKWDTFKTLAQTDTYENSDESPKNDQRSSAEFHIAKDDWLAAESNYKKQQAVIFQAQAALTSAHLSYQATMDTTVKATAGGVVANLQLSVGDTVQTKSSTLMIISEVANTQVDVSLNEVDIPKVAEGQKAEVTLDAFPGKTFNGSVKSIDTVGTNTSGVITYRVLISILNPGPGIKPGMTANVDIETADATNVLTVPNNAVKPYQGKKAVQILDARTKKTNYIPVVIGIKGTEKTEIKSGIAEGSEVITGTKNGPSASALMGPSGQ
ncbi:hypothetical protein A3D77_06245 [Candidatus Gottesmanbacteria bacterium RIFCSPHIGHO2_02_FULL_39_11]|uniref:RND efflux pump membrane fusion protein barrel-sandwich domain-containing protein n=1 Tax=Candidatus Gottesmanbacteria bacterium RIFCSPHIGHO2_02_FULL_39_11 TaxID=1798382 RepID=A0A1F5ZVZ0_9BACT|nr:MAG: hypothetical protein A3D77_06245 [Candidatus Gottesmanbacteria bacterium RIFCSPHIGHO2_02_FULL_39_11]